MKSLKDKMNLYAGRSAVKHHSQTKHETKDDSTGLLKKESQSNPEAQFSADPIFRPIDSKSPPKGDQLLFGDYLFKKQSESFYLCKLHDHQPAMGNRSINDHTPLNLSGILELSNLHEPEALHPEDVLFLDTETTGLSRGVATIPFLIGVCWLEGKALVTELIFIQNPIGEEAALDYLSQLWQRFRYMVSYNGKAFDIPLIRNRMILHRKQGLKIGLHFDMLHIMRKLFVKGAVPSHKQQEMERELLGFERTGDLPGAEIPQVYFDYVKYDYDRGLERVFHHNHLDLRGLTLIFLEAIAIYRNRDDAPLALRSGLARILIKNREEEQALELLIKLEGYESRTTDASSFELPVEVRYRDRMLLAWLYRRQRNYVKSAQVLESLVEIYHCPYARMALAKLQEHQLNKLELALALTSALIEQLYPEIVATIAPESSELKQISQPTQEQSVYYVSKLPSLKKGIYTLAELQRRVLRIEKKLHKQAL